MKLKHIGIYLLVLLSLILIFSCQTLTDQIAEISPEITIGLPTHTDALAWTASPSLQSSPSSTDSPAPVTAVPSPTETPTATSLRFAVIGDYGQGDQHEQEVADLVKSWNPDLIITTGDNNYPSGSAQTIDQHIGQFYHEFIYPYEGAFGAGADRNRFFPTLGNHDLDTDQGAAYFEYFTLPGNERYYDFVWEPVHFFAVNSDSREPDGVGASSTQAQWLKDRLATSTSIWKVVYFHVPPYSSGPHGSTDWMRWPFKDWGATVALAGHNHIYERLLIDGFPYFVNGLGGGPIYDIGLVPEGSQMRYNAYWGAMLVVADNQQITFQFINAKGKLIDSYQLVR